MKKDGNNTGAHHFPHDKSSRPNEQLVMDVIKKITTRLFPTPANHHRISVLTMNDNYLSSWLCAQSFQVTTVCDSIPKEKIPGVTYLQADEDSSLPVSDNSFHLVLSVEMIGHISNPYHVLREIARVLQPGGYLVLSTPNIHSFKSRMKSPILDAPSHPENATTGETNHPPPPISIGSLLYSFKNTHMKLIDLYSTGPRRSWGFRLLKSFINAFTFQMMKNFGRAQRHRQDYYLNHLSDRQLRRLIDATTLVVIAQKEKITG